MDNRSYILNIVREHMDNLLDDWLPFRSMPINIKFFSGSKRARAYVATSKVKDNSGFFKPNNDELDLMLSEDVFLNKNANVDELIMTITHEVFHIIQRNVYSDDELRDKRSNISFVKNNISINSKNRLELEAEVFTINIHGRSYNSLKGAKDNELYKQILSNIINMDFV